MKTISPIDGSVYVERAPASDKVIEQALEASVTAQQDWPELK